MSSCKARRQQSRSAFFLLEPGPDRGQWRAWGASLHAGLPESHLQTLLGINQTMSNEAGAQLQSCSSRSRKHRVAIKPAVRTRSGDFFRYTDAGKILLLVRLPGRVMFGRLQWFFDGRENCLFLLQSRPARRHGGGPAGRTCSVQVGRGQRSRTCFSG